MLEAWEAARRTGIAFSFDDPVAHVTEFAIGLGEASPSMRLDHLATFSQRRRTLPAQIRIADAPGLFHAGRVQPVEKQSANSLRTVGKTET